MTEALEADARPPRDLFPVHVGCSGWNYASWRGALYPQTLAARGWLHCYGERFDTVEVNATFYRLISRSAVENWVRQAPPPFVFSVKASRYLTHVKRLADVVDGTARLYERIEPLVRGHQLGAVLWQLPETFHADAGLLQGALEALPAGRHAFEFRHASWFATEVYDVLRRHDAALVVADHPQRPFQTCEATASWRYVRLHFGRRGRRGNYSDRELEAWAIRLHAWRRGGELFVYFNNDWEGFAPRNAAWLQRRLASLAAGELRAGPRRRARNRRRA
jgi:uncharacterized protein YecE (DUF72 family)